jgi:hypothetical protein
MGNLNKTTKFGYGTFWPSNLMHDNIPFPDKPIEPIAPVRRDYKDELKFKAAEVEYEKALAKYKRDKMDYKISMQLKPNATFHHLYLVYDGSNRIIPQRLSQYMNADIPIEAKLRQEFLELEDQINKGQNIKK